MWQARRSNSIESNTIILIDEAWLLMQFPQGAKFLEEFARRIGKYGGGLWCTTQTSDAFLRSDQGKVILALSGMKFVMEQDSSTIDSFTNAFNLSPEQRAFLLEAKCGEGLFATKTWTQMEVVASPMEAVMASGKRIRQSHMTASARAYLVGQEDGSKPVKHEKRGRPDSFNYRSEEWQKAAHQMVENCVARLWSSADTLALDYTHSRGFSDELILKARRLDALSRL